MLHLMNSTMMPQPGVYYCNKVSRTKFVKTFNELKDSGWKSYIGYPQLAKLLFDLLKVEIKVSREITRLKDGDVILAARLPYRVDPGEKGNRKHGSKITDYEFFVVGYSKK